MGKWIWVNTVVEIMRAYQISFRTHLNHFDILKRRYFLNVWDETWKVKIQKKKILKFWLMLIYCFVFILSILDNNNLYLWYFFGLPGFKLFRWLWHNQFLTGYNPKNIFIGPNKFYTRKIPSKMYFHIVKRKPWNLYVDKYYRLGKSSECAIF